MAHRQVSSSEKKVRFLKISKRLLLYIFLTLYSFIIVFPIFLVGINSLKDNKAIFATPWSIPQNPRWLNYGEAWIEGKIGRAFFNSVLVTGVSVFSIAFIAPMAAYPLARMKFFGKKLTFYLFMSGMFIAQITGLVPLLKLLRNLNFVNTYWGLIFPNIAFGLSLSIFLIRSFFIEIPNSIDDACKVDGIPQWKVYWYVMLPMAMPAVFTVIILQTVYIWNEFLFGLAFIRTRELFTLPRALLTFKGTYITSFGPLNAAVILAAIPTIILYSLFSDKIRRAISIGFSEKG
ncbi:MAG: carbohydrate ABC transporter permease [Spirochaetota bacterium]